ncbi:NucA/NucB deoxyribonuclease domain-containing protein [Kitasatospora sp. NPDC051705]|uniref:NucA/NucB deoxyribonuclease domain-containing protein n=1 Tax=Kitasatospora sp. NPDC051705 TaxID=3364057 RepID=UPI0037A8A7B0
MNIRPIRRFLRAAGTGVCAVLLAAGTIAASPAVARGPQATGFVPASTVSAEELARLGPPVPFSEYVAAQQGHGSGGTPRHEAAALSADDADLKQECAKRPEADSPAGWVKNRFETCIHRHYDVVLRREDGTETIGRLQFEAWLIGFAYDGQRKVDYLASVEDIIVQTVNGEDAKTWSINQEFTYLGGPVTAPGTQRRNDLLGAWNSNPTWSLTYTSPDNGPLFDQGNQQIVNTTVTMSMNVKSPSAPSRGWQDTDAAHSDVRFDYAGPTAGKHKGTVFTAARVELVMKLSDPAVRESARHIADAQNNPERTFPSFAAKTIPGAKEPLHRLVDREEQKKNRAAAIKTCDDVWGDYTKSGLECDEYPFASTKEGANRRDSSGKAVNRYSARLIDGDDNGKGGNMIGEVYSVNRLLDGDPFYVKIVP